MMNDSHEESIDCTTPAKQELVRLAAIFHARHLATDYLRFVFFCVLLLVPAYAIVYSAMKYDWLMVIIDLLLVPVGFVHGILLLLGVVT